MRNSSYMTLGMAEPVVTEHEAVPPLLCEACNWPSTACQCIKKLPVPPTPKPKAGLPKKKYKVGHKTFVAADGWKKKVGLSFLNKLILTQVPHVHITDEAGQEWCNWAPHQDITWEFPHAPAVPKFDEIMEEAKSLKIDEDEDEVTDCCSQPVDDLLMCDGCDDGTCVDCCSIQHCSYCSRDLSYNQCDISGEECKDCCGCTYCESCYDHQPDDSETFCYGCFTCHGCGCSCGKSSGGFGSLETTPWEARGIEVLASEMELKVGNDDNSWKDIWEINDQVDPAMEMANFYLLDGIAHMVFNGGTYITQDPGCQVIAAEAKKRQAAIVAKLDPIFQRYVDMVVGGELRHHRAVADRSLNRMYRPKAWAEWKALRKKVGVQALKDAAVLFRDFGCGAYGGEAWASCTELLIYRLDGTWDPRTFVDRVFSAQHNGGSLLNKIQWKIQNQLRRGVDLIKQIGDCHDADPPLYSALLTVASPEVRRLFSQWWKQANTVHREHGKPMTVCPKWTDGIQTSGPQLSWGRDEISKYSGKAEFRPFLTTLIYDGPLYIFTEYGKAAAKQATPKYNFTSSSVSLSNPYSVADLDDYCKDPKCCPQKPKVCNICNEDGCDTEEGEEHWNKVTGVNGCWCDNASCLILPGHVDFIKQPAWSKKLQKQKASWEQINHMAKITEAQYKALAIDVEKQIFGIGEPQQMKGVDEFAKVTLNASKISEFKGATADIVVIDDIF